MKIVVLGGGLSPERDVSLKSASLIANALLSKGHEVALVDLYDGIENDRPAESFFRRGTLNPFTYSIPEVEPDLEEIIRQHGGRRQWVGPRVIEFCQYADRVFLGLHGSHGENGQVQALLDAYDVKYTGCGYLGCAIAMDKALSKALIAGAGIPTAKWISGKYEEMTPEKIKSEIGIPCVIKPIGCGSSCGVSIVKTEEEFGPALEWAASYKQSILVEQFIRGREVTIGVVGHKALPITEIIPHEGFYDYKNKYQAGSTVETCPADISQELTEKMQDLAVKAAKALKLEAYSRLDFLMKENGDMYCLEANTLPGMTPTSLIPQEAKVLGMDYSQLCEELIRCSMKKYR